MAGAPNFFLKSQLDLCNQHKPSLFISKTKWFITFPFRSFYPCNQILCPFFLAPIFTSVYSMIINIIFVSFLYILLHVLEGNFLFFFIGKFLLLSLSICREVVSFILSIFKWDIFLSFYSRCFLYLFGINSLHYFFFCMPFLGFLHLICLLELKHYLHWRVSQLNTSTILELETFHVQSLKMTTRSQACP